MAEKKTKSWDEDAARSVPDEERATTKKAASKNVGAKRRLTPSFPVTAGACADRYLQLDQKRSELLQAADIIEDEMKLLHAHMLDTFDKQDLDGAVGKKAVAKVQRKQVPSLKDWQTFTAYVKKTGRFELLQRRLAVTAVNEIWDTGKSVPGVEPFDTVKIKVTQKK